MKKGECRAALKKVRQMELLMMSDLDEALLLAAMGFILFRERWVESFKGDVSAGGVL